MTTRRELVLGTHNRKKGIELAAALEPFGFALRVLADIPESIEVVEDGDTFAANAERKATQQAVHLHGWVLAEDSGLAVDSLDGAPGVFSARFAGPDANDQKNNTLLLERLEGVDEGGRGAHYICHAVLADPAGKIRARAEAICRGRILREERGDGGFGYDPLFEIVEYHRTFAELGAAVKSALSHRARAMRSLTAQIIALVQKGEWRPE